MFWRSLSDRTLSAWVLRKMQNQEWMELPHGTLGGPHLLAHQMLLVCKSVAMQQLAVPRAGLCSTSYIVYTITVVAAFESHTFEQ